MTTAVDPQPDAPAPAGAMTLEQLRCEPLRFRLDVPYAQTPNPRQRLDIYLPNNPAAHPLPVLVYIHGGGWIEGDKAVGAGRLLPFVLSRQFAGIALTYRLSGEAIWPAQIHDCKAAIRWIRAHATEYGFDPQRIAVWGSSAGGHLALMLAFTAGMPELDGDRGPHRQQSTAVSAVVNYFGPTDFLAAIDQPSDLDRRSPDVLEARLIGGALLDNPGKARAASPITYVRAAGASAPPIFTMHGEADRVVPYDQSVRLHAALDAANIPNQLVTVPGGGHAIFPEDIRRRAQTFLTQSLLG